MLREKLQFELLKKLAIIHYSAQCCSEKKKESRMTLFSVIAAGFEPATVCLEGRCSIQLSYATFYKVLYCADDMINNYSADFVKRGAKIVHLFFITTTISEKIKY